MKIEECTKIYINKQTNQYLEKKVSINVEESYEEKGLYMMF